MVFPICYILRDVLTEAYGDRRVRLAVWQGFGGNALMVATVWVAIQLPRRRDPGPHQAAFRIILGVTPRLLGASFLTYLIAKFSNAFGTGTPESDDRRAMALDADHRIHAGRPGAASHGVHYNGLQTI